MYYSSCDLALKVQLENVSEDTKVNDLPQSSRYRRLKTVVLFCSFFGFGIAAAVIGPSIVSMEMILDSDTKSLSAAFSGHSLGYLLGALVCGLIYAHINKELLFTFALCGIATAMGVAPFSINVYMFVADFVLVGFSMSLLDTGAQSYILKLWEDHKFKKPMLQGLHSMWSVGSTIGPFILKPFLVDIPEENVNGTSNNQTVNWDHPQNSSHSGVTLENFTPREEITVRTSTDAVESKEDVTVVRIGFLIIAGIILLSAISFFVTFIILKPSCRDRERQKKAKEEGTEYSKSFRRFRLVILLILFLFTFSWLWIMSITGSFLAPFVVKGLGWANNRGALIMAAFWGANGVSRVCSIPLSTALSPRTLVLLNLSITSGGLAILWMVQFNDIVVWVGVIITGLGMGSTLGCVILWTECYIEFTGVASSVLFSAGSAGGILAPLVAGYLFDSYGHMVVVYITFTASIVQYMVFIAGIIYVHRHEQQKHDQTSSAGEESNNVEQLKPLNKQLTDIKEKENVVI